MNQPLTTNEDFASSPVDILEPESYQLTSAETKTGQQKQDGIVALAGEQLSPDGARGFADYIEASKRNISMESSIGSELNQ